MTASTIVQRIFSRFIHLWIAVGIGILVIGLTFTDFYELIELKTYDQRMVVRNALFGPPEQLRNVATLDVDDYSVAAIGRFEDWPRTYHARIVDIANALGAWGVGIDFLLLEESTPRIVEAQVRGSAIHSRADVLALFENPDHVVAASNARWQNVYYAQYLAESEVHDYDLVHLHRPPLSEQEARAIEIQKPYTVPITADFQKNYYVGTQLWAPVDTILSTAAGAGQVQPIPDRDGIVRRNRVFYAYDGRLFPTLSLVMAADYLGVPMEDLRIERNRIVLPDALVPGESSRRDVVIPITDRGEVYINWAGDFRSTYRHYPYESILVFWESHQRDRLAASLKRLLHIDPNLLMDVLEGQIELSDITISLMLDQAGLPRVNVVAAAQEVAVAMRLAPLAEENVPFNDAVVEVFGRTAAELRHPARWQSLYESLRANHRIAELISRGDAVTARAAAQATGLPIADASRRVTQLNLLASPETGQISPGQYPLWFFERTMDGTPVSSRDVLNSQFATAMKHWFRTHVHDLDQTLQTIDSDDPNAYAYLADLAVNLIAESAGFPQQDYHAVVDEIIQAALLEPFIAEGMSFDDVIIGTFGVSPADVPEDIIAPYYATYIQLQRNLRMADMLNEMPWITLDQAADSLTALNVTELGELASQLAPEEIEEFTRVRMDEIAGDFYTLQHFVEEAGRVPRDAHPLVFHTVIVDGRPVFASDFRNTVLFYGITSTGGHDRNPMPFEPRYPMVGMHANLFNQMITGQHIYRSGEWVNWLTILALALIIGIVIPRVAASAGAAIMVVIVAGFLAVAVALFAKLGLWIDTVGPTIVVVAGYLGITVRNYIVEEREKKFIKGAFANYLAPEVVEQIAENPEGLKLGGDNFDITAFFSDVQGFSTISQALTAQQLVELLNEYLTEMCDIIIEHQGTVDKFEGDAIIAFFGAPIAFEDHAARACLSTIAMQERLNVLRPVYHERYGQDIYQRIGMNSGECVVGNMGSRSRFDYTMMGDHVNLAARLESGAKQYGVYSQISDSTYNGAKDHIEARELDSFIVVGRLEPVTSYELLSRKGELDPVMTKVRDLYTEGLAYYREKQWEKAIAKFTAAHEARGGPKGDPTSLVMRKRCETVLAGEIVLPDDWNGVWSLTEK